ncbi:helix-turn-helix transcriptional regulator [[Clostridium] fimetarium]|uniref:LuxR family transcriptional regulator, maltose regulon positive regulatory protein n=1 Tax=[Clostridium] fimetarium TaxID=99656 RepID=A0A1I0RI34_9FIRM|nr:LuxR family transcriptional regulator [[Clostridium] fimetarium]SEW40597.1 LuxR family transcriptional regulator, maltose regulon positive regulatory protein [[Clostridium] fimetarium]
MANTKTEKKKIYISKNLRKKLFVFENYSCTVVTAPTGYGKTTVLKQYFNSLDYRTFWIDGDSSQELFWFNLCIAIESTNPEIATQLRKVEIPTTDKDFSIIISLLRKLKDLEKTVLIIDDYYLVENEINNKIFSSLINLSIDNLKIIFITRSIKSTLIINLVLRDKVGTINKEDFKYTPADINEYFRLNEVLISSEDVKQIYDYSCGWPFIIKLQLLSYATYKKLDAFDSITTFIQNDIWKMISEKERDFLIRVCLFEEFSLAQAIAVSEFSPNEVMTFLDYNEHIDYNYERRTYHINPIYLEYIRKFFIELPVEITKNITIETGKLYENKNDFFSAIQCFHSVKAFDLIYSIKPQLNDLYGFIIKENKRLFFDIANNYWTTDKHGNYEFGIILSFILFIYNERQMMESLVSSISKDIKNDDNLSVEQQAKLHCELTYISAYYEFNDFSKMNDHFMNVCNDSNEPLKIIVGKVPFSLGSPSIMALYHTQSGMLDNELNTLEVCAPNYYRITNGHGKGFEAIMKAEILYNRGEYESSEILCHKAMYMADSRSQSSMYICALLLLARLAICTGDNDAFNEYINSISSNAINYFQLNTMADISKSFLYATICDKDNINSWLKDHKLIEEKTNIITLSYTNLIYGKYLILNQQYHHFLGISGQFIGLTKVFSYVLPRIYTYIYLAIANKEVQELQKSHKFLLEAIELAVKDNVYMPFVENYSYLEILFDETNLEISFLIFLKNVKKLAREYSKGLKVIQKANSYSSNFGLTHREIEIAKLAVKRFSNKEIGDFLFIAESTVKSNMKMIFNKLSINSRVELNKYFNS